MGKSDSNDSSSPAGPSSPGKRSGEPDCPLRRVLAANQHGVVVESVRGFEVGSSMVLGCLVEGPESIGGGKVSESTGRGSVFISAETIVVESQQRIPPRARRRLHDGSEGGTGTLATTGADADAKGEPAPEAATVYQVTLMFSDISAHDRELLENLSRVDGIRLASRQLTRQSGLAIPPPQVLPLGDFGGDAAHNKGGKAASGMVTDIDSAAGAAESCSLN